MQQEPRAGALRPGSAGAPPGYELPECRCAKLRKDALRRYARAGEIGSAERHDATCPAAPPGIPLPPANVVAPQAPGGSYHSRMTFVDLRQGQ
jgi:hypothetical protein